MSGGLYKQQVPGSDTVLDLQHLKPYGDTMNDGMVQVSFTLPIPDDEKGAAAALELAGQMGLSEASVAHHRKLDSRFTFYIIYGSLRFSVDYTRIRVAAMAEHAMPLAATDELIRNELGRKIVVVGASTGSDAHTVGIDAILNRKGFAGHYGLERYEMFETYNLGSQVANEALLQKALQVAADVLLVSQTVTQKDVHILNLTELVELAEAEGVREQLLLICGGARITNELAKELGYDAGFGAGKYADDVATFIAKEMIRRHALRRI